MISPEGSIITSTLTGKEIPEIIFHPSLKVMVSSLIGVPLIVVLPALSNLSQYP